MYIHACTNGWPFAFTSTFCLSVESKHIAAIEQAIISKGELDHTLIQGVFLGPGRSGKSSTIHRLLKQPLNSISPSTGVADKVIQVEVRKSSTTATSVSDSIWLPLTFDGEMLRLLKLTVRMHRNTPTSSEFDAASHEMPEGYTAPRQTFEATLRTHGIVALHEHLDKSWFLYLSDTGGQMEFQELLPMLVSGPSLFFIVFPLNRPLDECFTVEYKLQDGQRSKPYCSSLTLMDSILQSLATIAAMGTFTYKGLGKYSIQLTPKVILVGTHKDMLDQSNLQQEIAEIDNYIKRIITSTSHYDKELIEFASDNQLIFTVNNMSTSDTDFALIRSRVEAIARHGGYEMSVPTHWLIFSIVLRDKSSRVVSYSDCFTIAKQCGIDTHKELNEALWFLHTKMGVVRHFAHGDLHNIVLTDPQLLFDKVTELIVNTFTFEKAGHVQSERFKKKGIFSYKDFERVNMASDPLLTPSRFISLLEHLYIVIPFLNGAKYFIPCVLPHADRALLPLENSTVPTLAITFSCGYCPKGVTGAVIKFLMTNEMQSEFIWELQPDQIFRDKVSFLVGPNHFTLNCFSTHFEVTCAPNPESTAAINSIQDTCHEVCWSIQKAVKVVCAKMNFTCSCEPTFYCSLCKSHIAKAVQNKGSPCALWCDARRKVCDFPVGYNNWLETEAQPAASSFQLKLSSAYKIVFSLASQWKNIGICLDIDKSALDKIEHDCKGVNNCLQELLDIWLKQTDPLPSWQGLADAVETFDPSTARKIRCNYCK